MAAAADDATAVALWEEAYRLQSTGSVQSMREFFDDRASVLAALLQEPASRKTVLYALSVSVYAEHPLTHEVIVPQLLALIKSPITPPNELEGVLATLTAIVHDRRVSSAVHREVLPELVALCGNRPLACNALAVLLALCREDRPLREEVVRSENALKHILAAQNGDGMALDTRRNARHLLDALGYFQCRSMLEDMLSPSQRRGIDQAIVARRSLSIDVLLNDLLKVTEDEDEEVEETKKEEKETQEDDEEVEDEEDDEEEEEERKQQELGQRQRGRSSRAGPIHVAFLQANPLNLTDKALGLLHEKKELLNCLEDWCTRRIRVCFDVATRTSLFNFLRRCQILHVSAHSTRNFIQLEQPNGMPDHYLVEEMRDALALGVGKNLQFVFISSCCSAVAAKLFVNAGVPHVVAVEESNLVNDVSARAFEQGVYSALFSGETIAEAFRKGRQSVIMRKGLTRSSDCCCAHTHTEECAQCEACGKPACCKTHALPCHDVTPCCTPLAAHAEHDKFVLLGDGAHDEVVLFGDVPEGDWTDVSAPLPPTNVPQLAVNNVRGRSHSIQNVILRLEEKRFVNIVGEEGIGKTTVACGVGNFFVSRRGPFVDGVFLYEADALPVIEMQDKHMLLILDGVSTAAHRDWVRKALRECPQVRILATSQRAFYCGVSSYFILFLERLSAVQTCELFYSRFPRDWSNDFEEAKVPKSVQDWLDLPLFQRIHGNPRLVEVLAELCVELPFTDMQRRVLEQDADGLGDEQRALLATALRLIDWPNSDDGDGDSDGNGAGAEAPSPDAASGFVVVEKPAEDAG